LRVSFTIISIQSVGLGHSKPAAGLMERPPIPPGRPILTRAHRLARLRLAWLAFAGMLTAVDTLSVISRAGQAHGLAVRRCRTSGPDGWDPSRLPGDNGTADSGQEGSVRRGGWRDG